MNRKKMLNIVIHAAVWIILFSLPYLLRPAYTEKGGSRPVHDVGYDIHYIVSCCTWVILFYLNAYILVPKLVYPRKYRSFLLAFMGIIGVLFCINWFSFHILLPKDNFRAGGFAFFYMFPSLFMMALSTVYRMFNDWTMHEREAKEKLTETLKTELAFLRSQVSPHFMFNVLNNMVALARKKSELLEPSLIKLSSLLRYMLYESDDDKVPLEKEIEYLENYIDLQKQRFGKNADIRFTINHFEPGCFIAPMLLIPFVENAFKHGTGFVKDAFIDIALAVKDHALSFSVANLYNIETEEVKDKTSGIGLNNVKRRLELIYHEHYQLDFDKKGNRFFVSLKLNL